MRIALLTMLDTCPGVLAPSGHAALAQGAAAPTPEGRGEPRKLVAELLVGGIAMARHQLALALALGVDKVLCLTDKAGVAGQDALWPALRLAAERGGVEFKVFCTLPALLAEIGVNDELIALADGLLAWPDLALPALAAGQVVLVQPVEDGTPRGFERLDLNHAAAGALRVPGRVVQHLYGLPADCDMFSSIQRAAVQAGIGLRSLPGAAQAPAAWSLVRSEDDAHAIEPLWIARHAAGQSARPRPAEVSSASQPSQAPRTAARPERSLWASPTALLAGWVVRNLGPALLHAGSGGRMVLAASSVLTGVALVLGLFGHLVIGFALCGVASLGFSCAAMLSRIKRQALCVGARRSRSGQVSGWGLDVALVLLLSSAQIAPHVSGWLDALLRVSFAPLVLIGLARLVPRLIGGGWEPWFADRGLLLALLLVARLAGVLNPAVCVLALGLLTFALLALERRIRLTSP